MFGVLGFLEGFGWSWGPGFAVSSLRFGVESVAVFFWEVVREGLPSP